MADLVTHSDPRKTLRKSPASSLRIIANNFFPIIFQIYSFISSFFGKIDSCDVSRLICNPVCNLLSFCKSIVNTGDRDCDELIVGSALEMLANAFGFN